jgi:regulator of RNase E activity RraB
MGKLGLDSSGFVKGAKDAEKGIGGVNDRIDAAGDASDKAGKGFAKTGTVMVAAAGVGVLALSKLVGSASDLNESVNAVNVTFGEAADGVLDLGEAASKTVGLSKTAFNGLAVQFSSFASTVAGEGGDVVSVLDDMTTRAADFASVMNIDVADAAAMFQSGLAGETEPLKKYGLDLSAAAVEAYALANGIGESGRAMTEAEKVQARYGALMEQTAKTAGDFANTSDSAANAQRILKADFENLTASIGYGLLPAMGLLVGLAGDIIGVFTDLPAGVQAVIGQLGGAAVAIAGVVGVGLLMVSAVMKINAAIKAMNLALMSSPWGQAALGITALVVAGAALWSTFKNMNKESDPFGGRLEEIRAKVQALREEMEMLGAEPSASDRFRKLAAESDTLTKALTGSGVSFDDLGAAALAGEHDLFQLEKSVLANGRAAGLTQDDLEILSDSISDTGREVFRAGGELVKLEAIEGGVTNATADTSTALQDLKDSLAENERQAVITQAAFNQLKGDLSDQSAYLDAQDGFDQVAEAAVEAYTAGVEGSDLAEQAARDHQRAVIDLKGDVISYAEEVGNISPQQVTDILALIDQGKLVEAESVLAFVARDRDATIHVRVPAALRDIWNMGGDVRLQVGARAGGGPVNAREPYIVGERGPELYIPDVNGRIIPAAQTAALFSMSASAPASTRTAPNVSTAFANGNAGLTINHYGPNLNAGDVSRGYTLARLAQVA